MTSNDEVLYGVTCGYTAFCDRPRGHDGEHRPTIETTENEALRQALAMSVEAIRLTREYVGEGLLPNRPGWAHFDATERARELLRPRE